MNILNIRVKQRVAHSIMNSQKTFLRFGYGIIEWKSRVKKVLRKNRLSILKKTHVLKVMEKEKEKNSFESFNRDAKTIMVKL